MCQIWHIFLEMKKLFEIKPPVKIVTVLKITVLTPLHCWKIINVIEMAKGINVFLDHNSLGSFLKTKYWSKSQYKNCPNLYFCACWVQESSWEGFKWYFLSPSTINNKQWALRFFGVSLHHEKEMWTVFL